MNDLLCERLPGCNSDSLDAYLRGLGFFLLAGRLDRSVRAWWDEDGVLNLASHGVEAIAHAIVEGIRGEEGLIRPARTPWRGKEGRGKSFGELRNVADEDELDWFDACALARRGDVEEPPLGRRTERSDRESNPIIGQGGGFGRSELASAHEEALSKVRDPHLHADVVAEAIVSVVRGEALSDSVSRRVSTTKAVLGAYQSGRATGPGLSSQDVQPTNQRSRTNAWDLLFVIEGLRAFRGTATRRPKPTARVQASFPLVTRARAIGTAPDGAVSSREDSPDTFELFAPLWSQPCSARALRHLIAAARLRTGRGVAQDTLDAVLVQAARAAGGLGFDRLVRFAFVPGSDPRYRYAVRRGNVQARASTVAGVALDEIVPFLRALDRAASAESPSLRLGRRRLEDALAALGVTRPGTGEDRELPARQAQGVLIALALMEPAAARASGEDLAAPSLSPKWFRIADDESPEYRLARVIAGGMTAGSASLLRPTILPHREGKGQWFLDAQTPPPDLDREGDPLRALAQLVVLAIRRRDRSVSVKRAAVAARPDDIALLLSGELGRDSERRLLLLVAALAGVWPTDQAPLSAVTDPIAAGIGADTARLMLAAQPADDEDPDSAAWIERAEHIASLLLAGRCDAARVVADRELRRRGLDLLPLAPIASPPTSTAPRLAIAVLLPLDRERRAAFSRTVSAMSIPVLQGGSL